MKIKPNIVCSAPRCSCTSDSVMMHSSEDGRFPVTLLLNCSSFLLKSGVTHINDLHTTLHTIPVTQRKLSTNFTYKRVAHDPLIFSDISSDI